MGRECACRGEEEISEILIYLQPTLIAEKNTFQEKFRNSDDITEPRRLFYEIWKPGEVTITISIKSTLC